jgi:hypothetical protein
MKSSGTLREPTLPFIGLGRTGLVRARNAGRLAMKEDYKE